MKNINFKTATVADWHAQRGELTDAQRACFDLDAIDAEEDLSAPLRRFRKHKDRLALDFKVATVGDFLRFDGELTDAQRRILNVAAIRACKDPSKPLARFARNSWRADLHFRRARLEHMSEVDLSRVTVGEWRRREVRLGDGITRHLNLIEASSCRDDLVTMDTFIRA